MIIDMNAYLGHWPFRRLRNNIATELIALMDEKGIDQACVSSIDAIFYKNSQAGNELLHEELQGHQNRLIPFAVINPYYVDWRHDLETCVQEFGCRGLRLYPNYHNYNLSDECCCELIERATEHGLIISLPMRQYDMRQQHWLIDIDEVRIDDLIQMVRNHPASKFVFLNGAGYSSSELGQKDNHLPDNYYIEMSRPTVLIQDTELPVLLENLGEDRLLFGTGMPFKYADPALVKMEVLEAEELVKAKIFGGNAARLLNL